MNIVNKISELLNEKMEHKNVLYALKGFNFIIDKINIDFIHIFDLEISKSINNINNIKLFKEVFQNDLNKFDGVNRFWCLYEELYVANKLQVLGMVTLKGYSIKVIDIGLFERLYPGFVTNNVSDSASLEFELDNNENTMIQNVYTKYYVYNNKQHIEYNDIDSISIEIEYLLNNYSEKFNEYTYDKDVSEDFSANSTPEKCVELFCDIVDKKYNKIMYYNSEDNASKEKFIHFLNILGVNVTKVYEDKNSQLPELYDQYLEVLKRIDKKYDFKEINIYKTPFINNNIYKLNQSIIIDEIYKNIIRASKKEPFKDIFVTAPTGAGKSILFQIPSIMAAEKKNLLTIVVSPLIGLMQDQVFNLHKMTELSVAINSEVNPNEKEKIKEDIINNKSSIIYLSPEYLLSNSDISSLIGNREIGLMVVDEAHTVATWGKNFRPDYWYLGEFISRLRYKTNHKYNFPIATFTATATISKQGTCDMYHDIIESLNMTPVCYFGDVKRTNIDFKINVRHKEKAYQSEKDHTVGCAIQKLYKLNEKSLVYFPYIKTSDEFLDTFKDCKICSYNGEMNKYDKKDSLEQFRNGEINMVFATKAFGMGIDIKDIKNVYHYAPTGTLSDYVQEIGRAARDQSIKGYAITDFYEEDFTFINRLYGMSAVTNSNIVGVVKKILNKYKNSKKLNFLVSADEFAYIFRANTNEDIENKLKATVLTIKKDFARSQLNFTPLIFKPRAMYTKGLFSISNEYYREMRMKGLDTYLKKVDTEGLYNNTNDVYELDFKELWIDKYNGKYDGVGFGKFKRDFYMNNLDLIDKFKLKDKMILEIDFSKESCKVSINKLRDNLNCLKSVFDEMKMLNKHFLPKEIVDIYLKYNKNISRGKLNNYIEPLIDILVSYNYSISKGAYKFCDYNRKTDRYHIVNTYYERLIANIINELNKVALFVRGNLFKGVVDLQKKNEQDKSARTNILMIIAQLFEIFEIAEYKCLKGDRPEYFVRVNSEKALSKIANDMNYQSATLREIQNMHFESVRYMKYFFENLTSNSARWEFIERYFLGQIEDNYKIDSDVRTNIKKLNEQYEYSSNENEDKNTKIYIISANDNDGNDEPFEMKIYVSKIDKKNEYKQISPDTALGKQLVKTHVSDKIVINNYTYVVNDIINLD